jgi:hypothetical protein
MVVTQRRPRTPCRLCQRPAFCATLARGGDRPRRCRGARRSIRVRREAGRARARRPGRGRAPRPRARRTPVEQADDDEHDEEAQHGVPAERRDQEEGAEHRKAAHVRHQAHPEAGRPVRLRRPTAPRGGRRRGSLQLPVAAAASRWAEARVRAVSGAAQRGRPGAGARHRDGAWHLRPCCAAATQPARAPRASNSQHPLQSYCAVQPGPHVLLIVPSKPAKLCAAGAQTGPGGLAQPPRCAGAPGAARTSFSAKKLVQLAMMASPNTSSAIHFPYRSAGQTLKVAANAARAVHRVRVRPRHAPPGPEPPMRQAERWQAASPCGEQHVRIPGRARAARAIQGGPGAGTGACKGLRPLTMYQPTVGAAHAPCRTFCLPACLPPARGAHGPPCPPTEHGGPCTNLARLAAPAEGLRAPAGSRTNGKQHDEQPADEGWRGLRYARLVVAPDEHARRHHEGREQEPAGDGAPCLGPLLWRSGHHAWPGPRARSPARSACRGAHGLRGPGRAHPKLTRPASSLSGRHSARAAATPARTPQHQHGAQACGSVHGRALLCRRARRQHSSDASLSGHAATPRMRSGGRAPAAHP